MADFRPTEKLEPSVAPRRLSIMTSDEEWGILFGGPSGE
jgi:hypothetical protein